MARTKSASNWEQYSLNQMALLAEIDVESQAPALGLTVDAQGRVPVRFFGRDYLVSRRAVEALDGGPVTPNHKSVLAHYLMSRGRGALTGENLPIGRLTGVISSGASPSDNLIQPLAEKFGDRYDIFRETAEKIGGRSEGTAPSGGESWLFHDLPLFPVRVIFFEADEEFPAEVKVLFDSSAPVFVSYEVMELMEMLLVGELLSTAGLLGCGGACGHHHD